MNAAAIEMVIKNKAKLIDIKWFKRGMKFIVRNSALVIFVSEKKNALAVMKRIITITQIIPSNALLLLVLLSVLGKVFVVVSFANAGFVSGIGGTCIVPMLGVVFWDI
jgi:hypothetical protein